MKPGTGPGLCGYRDSWPPPPSLCTFRNPMEGLLPLDHCSAGWMIQGLRALQQGMYFLFKAAITLHSQARIRTACFDFLLMLWEGIHCGSVGQGEGLRSKKFGSRYWFSPITFLDLGFCTWKIRVAMKINSIEWILFVRTAHIFGNMMETVDHFPQKKYIDTQGLCAISGGPQTP